MRLLHWVVICDNQKYINMDHSKVCGIYKLRPSFILMVMSVSTSKIVYEKNRRRLLKVPIKLNVNFILENLLDLILCKFSI